MTQQTNTRANTSAAAGSTAAATGLDAQYAELIEIVFACEQAWKLDDRIALAVRCQASRVESTQA